jgi:hypothetical protein
MNPGSTGGGCALPGQAPSLAKPLATHSTEQTLYFDNDGLLARHDYDVEISGGTSAAHYVSGYDDVEGIKLPTKHRIFPRNPDGQSLDELLIVGHIVASPKGPEP